MDGDWGCGCGERGGRGECCAGGRGGADRGGGGGGPMSVGVEGEEEVEEGEEEVKVDFLLPERFPSSLSCRSDEKRGNATALNQKESHEG